ncbi:type VII secretion-associated serine protease mycosin [Mycolicibacterium sp. XJ2546]
MTAARLLLAALLVVFPVCVAAPATAVTPPPVDDSRLPRAASPAPPQPTRQREPCVLPVHSTEATTSGQLDDLGLASVWPLTRGRGQTIAVVDTGVAQHRLLPHLVPGGDYVSSGDGTQDCDGHGTIVAGIVGAAEEPTFQGVAPDATIIAIRQSSTKFRAVDDASGSGFGNVDTLAMAVRTAADMGATVINVSSVACLPAQDALDDRALGAALAYAVDIKNAVVVAAAGNVGGTGQCPQQNPAQAGRPDWSGVHVVVSPAWYDDYVLTVGSVAPNGTPSAFSLAGPWVDVAAPGEGVVSLDPDGEGLIAELPGVDGATPIAGTSYAAPVVSGVAALLRSRAPELTARQVMQRIETTARHPASGWNPIVGHGVVDPVAAVTGGPVSAPPPSAPRTVSMPAPNPPDERPAHIAVRGAAICVALSGCIIAGARLRRRSDAVAHD